MSYRIFNPGSIDTQLAAAVLEKNGLSEEATVPMLPYGERGNVGFETRRLYFALALTDEGKLNTEPILQGSSLEDCRGMLPVTRIFSFGACNVACPYCKRDCQFVGDDGLPIVAIPVAVLDLIALAEGAHSRGETVRFSGGDPVMFPKVTIAIAEYMWERHQTKVSIAHNGTGPAWVRKLLPYLSSAAIDLKGTPERIGAVMGIAPARGPRMFELSCETQRLISGSGSCLMDVRTPVFGDTSLDDMLRLAERIGENDPAVTFWTWRMYKPVEGCDWTAPEKERVFGMMADVSALYPKHWLGIRAKWEKGGMVYFLGGQMVNQGDVTDSRQDDEGRGSGNLPTAPIATL